MLNYCKSCKYYESCGDFNRAETCEGHEIKMDSIIGIEHKIEALRSNIAKKESEIETLTEEEHNYFKAAREAYKNGNEEAAKKHKAEADNTMEKITAISVEADSLKKQTAIYRNNLLVKVLSDAMPIIIEEFAKYDGKPYGEKTRSKISEAIQQKANVRVYIDKTSYKSVFDSIDVYTDLHGYRSIAMYTEYDKEAGKRPELLIDNKINASAFKKLISPHKPTDYIEAPAEYVEELRILKEEAEHAKNKLIEACNKYNALSVEINNRLSTYYKIEA